MWRTSYKVASREVPVDVQLDQVGTAGGPRYGVRVGPTENEVEAGCLRDGQGWFLHNGRVVRFWTCQTADGAEVFVHGRRYCLQTIDRRLRRGRAPHAADRMEDLCAPMPGTILKIVVSAGESFAAHQPLIIMESMKMEMTLSSPHAGRVKEIHCKVGELVPMGRLLAELDSEAGT